jgi:predicted amidophosphoribosyltransferase
MVTAIRHAIRDIIGELLGQEPADANARPILPGGVASPSAAMLPVDDSGSWCLRCGYSVRVRLEGRRCCGRCAGRALARQGTVRLCGYGDERGWSNVVREVKFAKDRRGARAAGHALAQQWLRLAASHEVPHPGHIACIVPVPMPWQRRIDRGIDHTWSIGQSFAGSIGVPSLPLLRQRLVPPQRAQGRSTRLQRAAIGARMVARTDLLRVLLARQEPFLVRGMPHGWALRQVRQRLQGGCRTVVLLDDVLTTGATIEECGATLKSLLSHDFRTWAAVACVTD